MKKKIGIVLGNLSGIGGTGRAVSILANEICDQYDISVVCYYQDMNKIGYALDERITIQSVFDKPTTMSRGILKYVRYLRRFIREEKVETLVVCGVLHMPGGIIAAKSCGIKVICCDHSNYMCVSDAKFERQCRNFAALFSDVLVTLTEKDIANYRANMTPRAIMMAIPNIVDSRLLEHRGEAYRIDSKKIVSVGRLTYAKNYEAILRIAQKLLKRYPDWSWDIYGEGELRKELENAIRENSLQRVRLMGNVPDMYDRYNDYAFLVMSSRYEGFPMVLLEAMAKGIPCVSYDCQTGPSDIILDQKNGLLVPANNEMELTRAVETLIQDDALRVRFSYHTSESVERFSTAETLKKWNSIL